MYMQHRHMVYGELHICHDPVLDQNVNNNANSNHFLHKALDVDHKMIYWELVGITIHFQICVQHQHYPEHDTLCLYIFSSLLFSYISLINDSIFKMLLKHMFLELFSQTDIIFVFSRMNYNLFSNIFDLVS